MLLTGDSLQLLIFLNISDGIQHIFTFQ